MTNFKAVLLDMDGTLVNTEKLWKQAERDLLAAHDRQYDPIVHAQFLGLSVDDFVIAMQKAYDLEHIDTAQLEQELEKLAGLAVLEKTEPNPGAIELVEYLISNDIPCAIASNTPHNLIKATLQNQRWADAITRRFSVDDVERGKPEPDLFLYAAEKLGVDPHDCIVVEDSLNGSKAAIAAGMRCLVVPDHELSDISAFETVTPHVFKSLHDVLKFIQQDG